MSTNQTRRIEVLERKHAPKKLGWVDVLKMIRSANGLSISRSEIVNNTNIDPLVRRYFFNLKPKPRLSGRVMFELAVRPELAKERETIFNPDSAYDDIDASIQRVLQMTQTFYRSE